VLYIGIDPGLKLSAYVVCDYRFDVRQSGLTDNFLLRRELQQFYLRYQSVYPQFPQLLIEKPICRKWAGSDVSETAIWTGVFIGTWYQFTDGDDPISYSRSAIRGHWGRKATDATIRQALIERFESDKFKKSKSGVWVPKDKEDLGRFTGFKEDIWQAFALCVYHIDNERGRHNGD
jgi:hypothetical protein